MLLLKHFDIPILEACTTPGLSSYLNKNFCCALSQSELRASVIYNISWLIRVWSLISKTRGLGEF